MWLDALMSDAKIPCPLRHFFPALEHRESMCGVFDKKKPASPEKSFGSGKSLYFLGKWAGFMVKQVFSHWKKLTPRMLKEISCLRVLRCMYNRLIFILFHMCVWNETKKLPLSPSLYRTTTSPLIYISSLT